MAHARVAKVTWDSGYKATRVPLDAPLARAVTRATQDALGGPVVRLPILGGSLPLDMIVGTLHAPVIVLPIVNHDNNQHASNENLRIQNLFDGVLVYAGVVALVGHDWK
jgi:acetylornithine deacetylase/succinyl-diaminopimelate desuccinylase-like protein